MFKCDFCGETSANDKAKFCSQCGPDAPHLNWHQDTINQQKNIKKLAEIISSLSQPFDLNHVKEKTNSVRAKLFITYDCFQLIFEQISSLNGDGRTSNPIRLFYDKNIKDSFAGHDTLIDFKIINDTNDMFLKCNIIWDDVKTAEHFDLKVVANDFISPNSELIMSANVVFQRSGPKSIDDIHITLMDEADTKFTFEANGVRLKTQNPQSTVNNDYSSNNNVSITGRGIIDAKNMGINDGVKNKTTNDHERNWVELKLKQIVDLDDICENVTSSLLLVQEEEQIQINENEEIEEVGEVTLPRQEVNKKGPWGTVEDLMDPNIGPEDEYIEPDEDNAEESESTEELSVPQANEESATGDLEGRSLTKKSKRFLFFIFLFVIGFGGIAFIYDPYEEEAYVFQQLVSKDELIYFPNNMSDSDIADYAYHLFNNVSSEIGCRQYIMLAQNRGAYLGLSNAGMCHQWGYSVKKDINKAVQFYVDALRLRPKDEYSIGKLRGLCKDGINVKLTCRALDDHLNRNRNLFTKEEIKELFSY